MIKAGDALEAARELDGILSEDTEYTGAYYNLGLAFKALGMKNIAIQFMHTYLDIDPDGYHKEKALKELAELGETESNV